MQCFYNVQPFQSFFCSFTVHVMILNTLAIFNVLDTTDFCMFRGTSFVFFPNNFRNPSSIVLDQPPSTFMIILYCWTVYPGYRSCNSLFLLNKIITCTILLCNTKYRSPCSFKTKRAFISLSSLASGKSLTLCTCTRWFARVNDAKSCAVGMLNAILRNHLQRTFHCQLSYLVFKYFLLFIFLTW